MTLSRNEQLALFVVVFLVVTVAGFFFFVLPQINEIETNTAIRDAKKAEQEELERTLGDHAFVRIGEDIWAAYQGGKGASAVFYDEEFNSFSADRLIQGILKEVLDPTSDDPENEENRLEFLLDNLKVDNLGTAPLDLALIKPTEHGYNIKSMARIAGFDVPVSGEGGMSLEEMQRYFEAAARNTAMDEWFRAEGRVSPWVEEMWSRNDISDLVDSLRWYLDGDSESILGQVVRFTGDFTQEQIYALSMHIFGLIDDEEYGATYLRLLDRSDSLGSRDRLPPELTFPEEPAGSIGAREYEFEIVFYIAEPMQTPDGSRFRWLKFPGQSTSANTPAAETPTTEDTKEEIETEEPG
jgi:hypothetical protein